MQPKGAFGELRLLDENSEFAAVIGGHVFGDHESASPISSLVNQGDRLGLQDRCTAAQLESTPHEDRPVQMILLLDLPKLIAPTRIASSATETDG